MQVSLALEEPIAQPSSGQPGKKRGGKHDRLKTVIELTNAGHSAEAIASMLGVQVATVWQYRTDPRRFRVGFPEIDIRKPIKPSLIALNLSTRTGD